MAVTSRPKYAYSVSGQKQSDEWTQNQALEMLKPLEDLSKKASAGQQMYLLTELDLLGAVPAPLKS
jgi:hypothetical protein